MAEGDSSQKHVYTGSCSGNQSGYTSCVLAFDPDTQSFVLDTLDADFKFNVISTPGNQSAKSLATAHAQLEITTAEVISGDEDLFDEDSTSEGDPENPYDYRHYLKRPSASPDPMDSLEPLDSVQLRSSPISKPRSQHSSQYPSRAPASSAKDSRITKTRPQRPPSPSDETDADNEDSSDDGGLEIVLDGAKIDPFQGKYAGFGSRGNSGSPLKPIEQASKSDGDASIALPFTGHEHRDEIHDDDDDDEDYDAMAEAIEAELEKQEQEIDHADLVENEEEEEEEEELPLPKEAESSSESEEE